MIGYEHDAEHQVDELWEQNLCDCAVSVAFVKDLPDLLKGLVIHSSPRLQIKMADGS